MAGFKALKDYSKIFEEELQRVSKELFSARVNENFDEKIAKKLRDLTLYTSKWRLLRAESLSLTLQESKEDRDETSTYTDYGDTVCLRLFEQTLVKSMTQGRAVKALITTPDRMLEPEMVERKENIKASLSEYRTQESTLQHLDLVLKEKQEKLNEVRHRWDVELTVLRDMKGSACDEIDVEGPYYKRMRTYIEKLEMMRWLIHRLCVPRCRRYDWLADPHRRLKALRTARHPHTARTFMDD